MAVIFDDGVAEVCGAPSEGRGVSGEGKVGEPGREWRTAALGLAGLVGAGDLVRRRVVSQRRPRWRLPSSFGALEESLVSPPAPPR